MPMVFDGESGCCDECGCPKTEKSFTLAAKPIADSRKAWDRQKTKEA
jgi:hypothetical protein